MKILDVLYTLDDETRDIWTKEIASICKHYHLSLVSKLNEEVNTKRDVLHFIARHQPTGTDPEKLNLWEELYCVMNQEYEH